MDQTEVIEALKNKDAYDEEVEKIEILQTHISYVFLTGKYAYKVKKAVNLGFLDYTTLEKRKFFCEEEVRINSLLSEDMYIGVVPINKKGDKIKIRGEGKTVEYAVKMLEMPQESIMTNLLIKNRVNDKHIKEIAKIIHKFHEKTRSDKEVKEYGRTKYILANWVQNFDQTKEFKKFLGEDKYFYIKDKVMEFIEKNKEFFEKRRKNCRVKECHGDLHSGNIFITDKIYIFDAIEFNKAFSCSDVANEVAFLAMDLDFHGRKDLSELFINEYIKLSGDSEIYKLLDFYKCYRAYVRAKVNCFKLADMHVPDHERKEAKELAKKYFDLAHEYAKFI